MNIGDQLQRSSSLAYLAVMPNICMKQKFRGNKYRVMHDISQITHPPFYSMASNRESPPSQSKHGDALGEPLTAEICESKHGVRGQRDKKFLPVKGGPAGFHTFLPSHSQLGKTL